MKKKGGFIIVFFCFLLFSCNNSIEQFDSLDTLISSAHSSTRRIDADALKSLIADEANIQIIDCREESLFVKGHIPHAISIPRGLLEFSNLISNRRLTTILIGNDQGSAALAAQSLKKLKYSKCYWVDCKWEDWVSKNPELVEKGFMGTVLTEKEVKVESSGGGCGE